MTETENKYNYNGITTEKERLLVCSATSDIKSYADTAFLMLEDIMSVHFVHSAASLRENSRNSQYFLANYEVISAKIQAAQDYIDQACTILDFIHNLKTHRTEYLPESLQKLFEFVRN